MIYCYEIYGIWTESFLRMQLQILEGFSSCYVVVSFVKYSIWLQSQIYRVFVEEVMRFYGLQMDFEFIIREFSLVLFSWFEGLQESSEFLWEKEETTVSFNLGFSVLLR